MSVPARTGVLIYAKNLKAVSSFYEHVLGAKEVHTDVEHTMLQSFDTQLIIHAIPSPFADTIEVPPVARGAGDQAVLYRGNACRGRACG